jgi:AcrR family transcriptional regulator
MEQKNTRTPRKAGTKERSGARSKDSRAGPRTRLKATDRKSQILGACMELFAERGFHGTRTRELAEKAGVSEALIFRFFPTKEALVRAILNAARPEEQIRILEQNVDHVSPREVLTRIAEQILISVRDHPDAQRLVFFGLMETPHLGKEFYRKFLSRVLAVETRLFERAFAEKTGRGRTRHADPRVAARSFHGSLLFYILTGSVMRIEPAPRNPRRVAEAIVNLYLPELSS